MSIVVINYDGKSTTVETGQTATLACFDKKMKSDVVVTVLKSSYLTFSSPDAFTLSKYKNWDGTLEYSTDLTTWNEWDGTAISADEGKLYLRGTGNTKVSESFTTGYPFTRGFEMSGANISCNGNIENLLDYKVVAMGGHPTMSPYCFFGLFYRCTKLTTAPELPATTLAQSCYNSMFRGCTSLTTAPELPATTLAPYCYSHMLNGCTSLTTAPELPATTLAQGCYIQLCYECSSLTTVPELPATTLAQDCYGYMFAGCPQIKLSTTQTDEYQTSYRIPTSGTGTTATNALNNMFQNTGGTFTGTPEINTTYYTSNTVV